MCGLVGIYSSNLFQRHKDCLTQLLFLDTLRGRDSTGVAAIRNNGDTGVMKSTVPGFEFVEHPRFNEHLRMNDVCWIGHNRYGTVGRNTKTNAHPFMIDDEDGACVLVGAHNGTLKNKFALKDHNQFGTDSEALFNHIAIHGIHDTIPIVEGAWALTWYDHIAEELRFLRNKERTLYYAYEEGKKSIIWASEQWMIRVACSRANIKLEEDKVWVVSEDTLYRFPCPEKTNDEITFEREGGLVGKTFGFFQPDRKGTDGGSRGPNRTNPQSQTTAQARTAAAQQPQPPAINKTSATTSSRSGTLTKKDGERRQQKKDDKSKASPNPEPGNVIGIDSARKYKGYGGKVYTKAEMQGILDGGCAWCQIEHIDISDKHGFLGAGEPICGKCLDGTHTPDVDEVLTDEVQQVEVGVTCH